MCDAWNNDTAQRIQVVTHPSLSSSLTNQSQDDLLVCRHSRFPLLQHPSCTPLHLAARTPKPIDSASTSHNNEGTTSAIANTATQYASSGCRTSVAAARRWHACIDVSERDACVFALLAAGAGAAVRDAVSDLKRPFCLSAMSGRVSASLLWRRLSEQCCMNGGSTFTECEVATQGGRMPLHVAAQSGRFKALEALLKCDAGRGALNVTCPSVRRPSAFLR